MVERANPFVERILESLKFKLKLEKEKGEIAEMASLAGKIKVGDAVKTLIFTKALYGRVQSIDARGRATIAGRRQPGGKLERARVHIENLDLIPEDELAPEDR